ncbi:MAG: hypothetical protein RR202_06610 [Bacteroidales bacterium]
MKELIRNAGVILVLIGVAILAVPYFTHAMSNTLLITGLAVIILGVIATIVFNRIAD